MAAAMSPVLRVPILVRGNISAQRDEVFTTPSGHHLYHNASDASTNFSVEFDRSCVITESGIILEWVAEACAPQLMPESLWLRARARAIIRRFDERFVSAMYRLLSAQETPEQESAAAVLVEEAEWLDAEVADVDGEGGEGYFSVR
eukprot:CAMPEP_0170139268 /NCGR_PEP_ID=MMETSP0033_2-20121228/5528_1 /TAXON_ID=195969 /ORGANISM="Dolichomastix tenuilepis, Strain CCMP3274" /LENGTH=145 /DNA_ID=CAMNT_0010375367 /DNA_START=116 /DNA_END=555 /DNA_ORIENTATION=-